MLEQRVWPPHTSRSLAPGPPLGLPLRDRVLVASRGKSSLLGLSHSVDDSLAGTPREGLRPAGFSEHTQRAATGGDRAAEVFPQSCSARRDATNHVD